MAPFGVRSTLEGERSSVDSRAVLSTHVLLHFPPSARTHENSERDAREARPAPDQRAHLFPTRVTFCDSTVMNNVSRRGCGVSSRRVMRGPIQNDQRPASPRHPQLRPDTHPAFPQSAEYGEIGATGPTRDEPGPRFQRYVMRRTQDFAVNNGRREKSRV